jgi:hypothetical protein
MPEQKARAFEMLTTESSELIAQLNISFTFSNSPREVGVFSTTLVGLRF